MNYALTPDFFEALVPLYLVVSGVTLVVFTKIVRRRCIDLGSSRWLDDSCYPGIYDKAMLERGQKSHARRWTVLLIVNVLLAAAAFFTVVVPASERTAALKRERLKQPATERESR
jgi:hypothetical protein